LNRRRLSAVVRGMRSRPFSSVMKAGGAYVLGGTKACPQGSGPLMSVNGSASGRLVAKRPLAGEHSGPLDLESWKKTVPLPVTGRVDRCWDVVPAAGVSTASLGRRWFSRRLLACSDVLDGRTGAAFRRG
jgi:hypothetical protein